MVFQEIEAHRRELESGSEDDMESLRRAQKKFLKALENNYKSKVDEVKERVTTFLVQSDVFPIDRIQEIWLTGVSLEDADCENEVSDSKDDGVYVRMGEENASRWLFFSELLPEGFLELEDFSGFGGEKVMFPYLTEKGKVKFTFLARKENQGFDEIDEWIGEGSDDEFGVVFDNKFFEYSSLEEVGSTDLVYSAIVVPVYPLSLQPEIQAALKAGRYPQKNKSLLEKATQTFKSGFTDKFLSSVFTWGVEGVLDDVERLVE